MPQNNPSFIQVKKWIIDAAPDYDLQMSGRRAKQLAGEYLASLDPELDEGRTDYADPTGTEAVKRWMKAWVNGMEQVAA